MSEGYRELTEKEKQTLRLIVRGHDAKSMARHLGLSVHTVNERLRDARRKLSVSSSREAARLLFETEGKDTNGFPQFLTDKQLGEAETNAAVKQDGRSDDGQTANHRHIWVIGGLVTMSLLLAALALSTMTTMQGAASVAGATTASPAPAAETEVVQSARRWLALVDEGRWQESWSATGKAFRALNTSQKWSTVSDEVRPPLGLVLSRTVSSQESIPAPPYGYEVVKFRTSFVNKPDTIETVSLIREDSQWKVVGYWIG
ncbi:regulatory protein, luxR family [Novosphingobium sp. CF614]|uniref:helix-turn-helix domain-containing protein n=1 Tax=Novosphingobium sp. CF614 TaxID=1884364 RepID=UPI0008DFECB2|nr:DUF4019 domain-containing protein [Novosphingobium sp. CF614]SFG22473.1 regulatory protein, luxR family [Novosphingobium sp. CF614]